MSLELFVRGLHTCCRASPLLQPGFLVSMNVAYASSLLLGKGYNATQLNSINLYYSNCQTVVKVTIYI